MSDKRPDGSYVLIFRPELELGSEDVVRRPKTEDGPDEEPEETVSPAGRLLSQKEVDRIRVNTDGERQLTGCALTLDVVRARPSPRVTPPRRPGNKWSSSRNRPPQR